MTRQGYRAFFCECGNKWDAATRDHTSPSAEVCADCGQTEHPIAAWPDPSLAVDSGGNLLGCNECDNNGCVLCRPGVWFACPTHPAERTEGNGWQRCKICGATQRRTQSRNILADAAQNPIVLMALIIANETLN